MKQWWPLMGLMIAACGGPDTGPSGTNNNPSGMNNPMMGARPAWLISHASTCSEIEMCPERIVHEGTWVIFARHPDEASCLQDPFVKSSGEDQAGFIERGLKEGRLGRDAAAWSACLSALETAGQASVCTDVSFDAPPECQDGLLYEGLAQVGEVCLHPRECAGDLRCYVENNGDCYATCQELASCAGSTCGEGQFCQAIGDTEECRPYKQLMQTCTASSECGLPGEGVCDFFATMEPETGRCVSVSGAPGPEPTPPAGAGAPCEVSPQCAWPLLCSDGICQDVAPTFGAEGEACDPQLGKPELCTRGLVCGVSLSVDQEAMMLIVDGACRPPSPAGGPCYLLSECEPGHLCAGSNPQMLQPGQCVAARQNGESCELDIECDSGYCKALGAQGQCSSRSACVLP